jgi:hypothetical protein
MVTNILARYELRVLPECYPGSFFLFRLVLLVSEYLTIDIRYGTCESAFGPLVGFGVDDMHN